MKQISNEQFRDLYLCALDELIYFFDNNNIQYSLAFGTMLGAFREHDIIEWDNDIDLFISSDDMEKLRRNETKLPERFKLDDYKRFDGNTFFMLNKVTIKDLYYSSGRIKNVWIDLYETNSIENSDYSISQWKKIRQLNEKCVFKDRKKGKNLFVSLGRIIIGLFIPSRKALIKQAIKIHSSIPQKKEIFGGFTSIYRVPYCEKYIKTRIRNKEYSVYSNCETALRNTYGDSFMTPMKSSHSNDDIDYFVE